MNTLTKVAVGIALTGTLAMPGMIRPAQANVFDDIGDVIDNAKDHLKSKSKQKTDESKQKANEKFEHGIDDVIDGKPGGDADDDHNAASKGYVVKDSRGNDVYFPLGELSFADEVVGYSPTKVPDHANDPSEALGPPNFTNSHGNDNYVSLGNGGTMMLQFTDNYLVDIEGPDLWIFEIGPAVEPTNVQISKDGVNWIDVGQVKGGIAGIDIGPKVQPGDRFTYVWLEDANAGKSPDGADIDAVGAIGSVIRDDSTPDGALQTPAPAPAANYVLKINLRSGMGLEIPMNKVKVITTIPKGDNGDCFDLRVELTDGTAITLDLSKIERITPVLQ